MNKKIQRERRAKKTRTKIQRLENRMRLTVFRSSMHIYAQIMTSDGAKTLVCASTLDKELRQTLKVTSNVTAAREVGKLIAARARAAGINEVAFDRAGFQFHGRVKALADAAREDGLIF